MNKEINYIRIILLNMNGPGAESDFYNELPGIPEESTAKPRMLKSAFYNASTRLLATSGGFTKSRV